MEIEGLNPIQMQLADLLWNCNTNAEVQEFLERLPVELLRDAETVYEMMVAAAVDDVSDVSLARNVLDRFTN